METVTATLDLEEAPLDPEYAHVAEAVAAVLVEAVDLDAAHLDTAITRLATEHGPAAYSQLIWLLTHLRFPGETARGYWREIVAGAHRMEERLGEFVDVRVAVASYFLQVNRQLRNPKLIELRVFEKTQSCLYRDELTGLYNFRFFRESLTAEVARALRTRLPVSLVMIDVDSFKGYNDAHGHDAGNAALATLAQVLSRSTRPEDIAVRFGGEEFALLLPATPKVEARLAAEGARSAVQAHRFPFGHAQPDGALTVSLGVATCPGDADTPDDLMRSADRALYAAKHAGRNRVHLYGESLRSFHRVRMRCEGMYRAAFPDLRPITIREISEGGVLFDSRERLPDETLIEVHVPVSPSEPRVVATARVVRVRAGEAGPFEVAARIVDVEPRDARRLSEYLASQRRVRRGEAPPSTP